MARRTGVDCRTTGRSLDVSKGGAIYRQQRLTPATSFSYPPTAHLVGETDGLRIQSSSACDFVQKVPGMSRPFDRVWLSDAVGQTLRSRCFARDHPIRRPSSSTRWSSLSVQIREPMKVFARYVPSSPRRSTNAWMRPGWSRSRIGKSDC